MEIEKNEHPVTMEIEGTNEIVISGLGGVKGTPINDIVDDDRNDLSPSENTVEKTRRRSRSREIAKSRTSTHFLKQKDDKPIKNHEQSLEKHYSPSKQRFEQASAYKKSRASIGGKKAIDKVAFEMSEDATFKLLNQKDDALTPYLEANVEEVRIFNVGQGNGIIVVTDRAFWIVDFGSNGAPTTFSKKEYAHTAKMKISEAQALLTKENYDHLPIIVMVTHPDTDHYALLESLLMNLTDSKGVSRIAHWIFSNAYDVNDLSLIKWTDHKLQITEKRFVITRNFVRSQQENQKIFFVNAPEINKEFKNANSMMLRVTIGGDHPYTILLSGDATEDTIDDIERSYNGVLNELGEQLDWKQQKEWILFNNIDYMVAPHHGSNTEGSHKLSSMGGLRKGSIFSAPIYSHHKHPTFDAVVNALRFSLEQTDEHLIYVQIDGGMTEEEIDEQLKDTDTKRALCYTFAKKVEFIEGPMSEILLLPLDYPKKALHCFLKTKRMVFVTGVSGDIQCSKDGCKPMPIFSSPDDSNLYSLGMGEEDLKFFVQSPSLSPKHNLLVHTKFSESEIMDIYFKKMEEENREKVFAKSTGSLIKNEAIVVRKSTRSATTLQKNPLASVDWNALLGVLTRETEPPLLKLII